MIMIISTSLQEDGLKKQAGQNRSCCCYNAWQHKAVVQNIFADTCCACSIKLNSRKQCWITRNKEMSVTGRKNSNQVSR